MRQIVIQTTVMALDADLIKRLNIYKQLKRQSKPITRRFLDVQNFATHSWNEFHICEGKVALISSMTIYYSI